ncbi:hypothetical protein [Rhizobacter sp. OV335]|uniref:hypothetical protein n=1 Tax=Rhizobacter sp. OV335 TaxID=1500264 RepID=UPI000920A1C6|nr:hypothetical protein [Rhizobacter sp. OV335]SHM63369.1 Leucine Rich repeat [Rhizobacter sp. OV335]
MNISSALKAFRPTTPRSSSESDVRAITSSNPPAFIAQNFRPQDERSWREAATASLRAADGEGAESLEWLSHHPFREESGDACSKAPVELNLSNMGLTRTDLRKLGAWLQSRKLQVPIKIDLSGNNFGDKCADELTALLTEPSCVTALNLSNCELPKRSLSKICAALHENTTLQELKLNLNRFQGCGEHIGAMLLANKTLKSLGLQGELGGYLERKRMGYQSIRLIAQALEKNSSLQALDLSSNDWGFKGAEAMAKMLKENKTLTELNHRRTPLHRGFKTLCKALEANTTLKRLDLSNNNLYNKQLVALGSLLKTNKSLQQLDLSYTRFECSKEEDWLYYDQFCEGLSLNTGLRELKIRPWTSAIDNALVSMLRNPTSHIEALDICGAPLWGKRGLAALTEAVQANQTLVSFKPGRGSSFTESELSAIRQATARNRERRQGLPTQAGPALYALLNMAFQKGQVPFLPREMARELEKAFSANGDVPAMINTIEAVTG